MSGRCQRLSCPPSTSADSGETLREYRPVVFGAITSEEGVMVVCQGSDVG